MTQLETNILNFSYYYIESSIKIKKVVLETFYAVVPILLSLRTTDKKIERAHCQEFCDNGKTIIKISLVPK